MYFMQHRDMHVTTTSYFINILLSICQNYIILVKLMALAPNMTPKDIGVFCPCHNIKNV